ncbi:MAG: S8 family serine peptidase, partial [Bacteroidaceae bacterium]|nr:S8 family serine peptidase [Bacteroidaceae bacterium]
MKTFAFLLATLLCTLTATAQETTDFTPTYKYRIQLKDKKHNPYSLKRPAEFLSQKSIARRQRQHLKLNETDLPVTPQYVEQIKAQGVAICSTSKWNNTVLVETSDTLLIPRIEALSFVSGVRKVATYSRPRKKNTADRHALIQRNEPVPAPTREDRASAVRDLFKQSHPNTTEDSLDIAVRFFTDAFMPNMSMDNDTEDGAIKPKDESKPFEYYGLATKQIDQLHGQALHERGFKGQGMTIAIIDGGFYNADIIPMLSHVTILGTRDFVEPGNDVYGEESHGMMVLSCIATNTPGEFVGTAPEASFWLLRSEDDDTEQPVEEDNWAAAVEFADSVGAEVVNTSLGYSNYDDPADVIKYWEMDGKTCLASRSASMMASKGMVLCNSAGNEGDNTWKLISVPADADDVLTVGALTPNGKNTDFSSLGNTADGRIKPDVMAMGQACTVLSTRGTLTTASGTSFASPIMCGMVTCYWQAHPTLTALEVVKAVRALGDNVEHPDNVFGFGTPDF